MKLKKTITKIAVAGLTSWILLTGFAVSAEDTKTEPAYVAIPMGMFKMLTSEQNKPEQRFYTYQDGKLVKCTTNLAENMKKNCKRKKCTWERFGRYSNNQFDRNNNETVLLTVEQLGNLKKQKMEQKLKEMASMKEKSAFPGERTINAKVNGVDVKIITMMPHMNPMMMQQRCSMTPIQNMDQILPYCGMK